MLVLWRKVGEKLCISDDITLVVKSVRAGRVSLGIEAPSLMKILRGELQTHEEPIHSAKSVMS
jgi:carbon storage regulator CsrA